MSKYYIYCSNNQAYHALINNSIMAKSMMKDDFRSDTVAYLSKDYIFITDKCLSESVKLTGIAETYYSVALEIETENVDSIKAYLVSKNENGSSSIGEMTKLTAYNSEKHIGAFICGEIPIAYLSGIIFDNEQHKQSFNKSSQDLWFPEDLKRLAESVDIAEDITIEILKDAAEKVDALLSEDDSKSLEHLVVKRNRIKAALYYAIEATRDWNIGTIRGNIDAELVRCLDKDGVLTANVKKSFEDLGNKADVKCEDFLSARDVVFDETSNEDINNKLFNHIISDILLLAPVRSRISEEVFNKICGELMDCAKDEQQDFAAAIMQVTKFLSSNMDPDETLRSLGKYDVLRAFMLFLDQQETADFLRRAATKLSQNERRYAYIMYGALNGMSEVEREYKANRHLEYRLEEIIISKYSDVRLISVLPNKDNCIFLKDCKEPEGVGIIPKLNIWYDCVSSQNVLLSITDEKILEKLYLAMVKAVKDEPISEQDIYSLKTPITITIMEGDETLQTFQITRKKDVKDFGKKIEKALKSLKEEFNAEGFKKYLADEKRYQKFYRKNTDLIQEYCRKVE